LPNRCVSKVNDFSKCDHATAVPDFIFDINVSAAQSKYCNILDIQCTARGKIVQIQFGCWIAELARGVLETTYCDLSSSSLTESRVVTEQRNFSPASIGVTHVMSDIVALISPGVTATEIVPVDSTEPSKLTAKGRVTAYNQEEL
jgi:hypothetical protein